ncbi:MAG TPA: recombinase family protein [Myxococcales bacterium]|nr:recombinase family protein [Myxococcales bacterium]
MRKGSEATTSNAVTAIYARISEDRQMGAGVGDQKADCMALTARHGWTRTVYFEDNDISASKYARKVRPRYRAMLASVRAGEINRIVVAHIDRLYRQPKELEEIIDLADDRDVEIVSVYSGPIDLSNGDGRAMARIQIAIAAKASDDTSRRVRRAMQRLREAGESTGSGRPFGWAKVEITESDGTVRQTWDPYTPDPEEADLIKDAARSIIEGASLADIARRWNRHAVPQPRQAPGTKPRWSSAHARAIITSPRNAGLVPHHRPVKDEEGKVRTVIEAAGPAKWPAIIDRPTWERCCEVIESRAPRWVQPRRRSLLTGLVRCGYCGGPMTRDLTQDARGNRRAVWRCTARPGRVGMDGNTACGRVSITAERLEDYVRELTFEESDRANVSQFVTKTQSANREYKRLAEEMADIGRQYEQATASAARRNSGGRGLSIRAYEDLTAQLEAREKDVQSKLAQIGDTSIMLRFAGRKGALRAAFDGEEITMDEQRAAIKETIGPLAILPTAAGKSSVDQRTLATPAGFTPIRMQGSAPAA